MEDFGQQLAALQAALAQQQQATASMERRVARSERRLRVMWALTFIGTLGAFVLGLNPEARAQFGVTLTSLNNRLTAVEAKTQDMSRLVDLNTNQPTVRFSGVNVQVVDGSGDTEGDVNGKGNLIIGYNEFDQFSGIARNGSHNLIVGSRNDYASLGGIVAGRYNTIQGRYATITAGSFNYATGFGSSVSGGDGNRATNTFSSVSGGYLNYATGDQSSVSGGVGVVEADTFGWSGGSYHTP